MKERKGHSRGTRKLSNVLMGVVEPSYKTKNAAEARLIGEWRQIVGDEIASKTQPLKLNIRNSKENVTLTLRVDAGHALEIQHMEPVILERIAAYMGYKAIHHIRLKQQ